MTDELKQCTENLAEIPWEPYSDETYNRLSRNNQDEVLCETDRGGYMIAQMYDGFWYIDNDVCDDLEEGWTPIAIARLHLSKFSK